MSEGTTEQPTGDAAETPAQEQPEKSEEQQPKAPDIDWKAKAREWERRAKENKAAADRLAELEEANKTEAQKLTERVTAAETAADEARREALRYKIATEFRLSDEDAEALEDVGSEEGMRKIAKRLAQQAEDAGKPRAPKPDRNQGRGTSGAASTADQFAAAIQSAL